MTRTINKYVCGPLRGIAFPCVHLWDCVCACVCAHRPERDAQIEFGFPLLCEHTKLTPNYTDIEYGTYYLNPMASSCVYVHYTHTHTHIVLRVLFQQRTHNIGRTYPGSTLNRVVCSGIWGYRLAISAGIRHSAYPCTWMCSTQMCVWRPIAANPLVVCLCSVCVAELWTASCGHWLSPLSERNQQHPNAVCEYWFSTTLPHRTAAPPHRSQSRNHTFEMHPGGIRCFGAVALARASEMPAGRRHRSGPGIVVTFPPEWRDRHGKNLRSDYNTLTESVEITTVVLRINQFRWDDACRFVLNHKKYTDHRNIEETNPQTNCTTLPTIKKYNWTLSR